MAKLVLALAAFVAVCNGYASVPTKTSQVLSYYLYTRDNSGTGVQLLVSTLSSAPFIADVPTVVLVHGHGGNYLGSLNPVVKNALLTAADVNVLVVDWSPYSSLTYNVAVSTVPAIGIALAVFLEEVVVATSVTLANIHLVGFNLGAHVAGITGRTLKDSLGTVPRITGLDPSASQWGVNSERLRITDANYVEVIHTDGSGIGSNGIGTAIGKVDFFANGGSYQPGCLTHACSHDRSFNLFAASLVNPLLVGLPCASNLQLTLNLCSGFPLNIGGLEFNKFGSGMYRINTGRNFPY